MTGCSLKYTALFCPRTGSEEARLYFQPPLGASTSFQGAVCEREIYAGWPDRSAEWLNTGLRLLDAKQTEN